MAPRTTTRTSDAIIYEFWLTFDRNGGVRLTRTNPGIGRDERAMMLQAELPLSLFVTPVLSASIVVAAPDGAAAHINIDIDAAAQAMRQALGVDVDLRLMGADQ